MAGRRARKTAVGNHYRAEARPKASKNFFFEKKKQKTSVY
jgi:hypothetical protein